MRTTTVFQSGNSQALRLPKDFQFHRQSTQACFVAPGPKLVIQLGIPCRIGAAGW